VQRPERMFSIDRGHGTCYPSLGRKTEPPPPKRGAGGWPLGGGAKSPRPPGENIMKPDEMEAKLHELTVLRQELEDNRRWEAHERARARVMLRDDVVSCTVRPDGTLLSLNGDGSSTLRPAGWRGRA